MSISRSLHSFSYNIRRVVVPCAESYQLPRTGCLRICVYYSRHLGASFCTEPRSSRRSKKSATTSQQLHTAVVEESYLDRFDSTVISQPLPAWLKYVAPNQHCLETDSSSSRNDVSNSPAPAAVVQYTSQRSHRDVVERHIGKAKSKQNGYPESFHAKEGEEKTNADVENFGEASWCAVCEKRPADGPSTSRSGTGKRKLDSNIYNERYSENPCVKRSIRGSVAQRSRRRRSGRDWNFMDDNNKSEVVHSAFRQNQETKKIKEYSQLNLRGSSKKCIFESTVPEVERHPASRSFDVPGLQAGYFKKSRIICSRRNNLIKHLVRLKRRRDIRRKAGKIFILGYPLIQFMCSTCFHRVGLRGGVSTKSPAKQDSNHETTQKAFSEVLETRTDAARAEAELLKNGASPNSGRDLLQFDFLLTDSSTMAESPSAFNLRCTESACASADVFELLMKRTEPEYLRKYHKEKNLIKTLQCVRQGGTTDLQRMNDSLPTKASLNDQEVRVSRTHICRNAVGVLKRPKEGLDLVNTHCLLALDGLRYVENVGLLVRAAAAFGFDGVYYVDGTADPFNWKAMEVSQGLHYNLPYCGGSPAELLRICEQRGLLVVVADVCGDSPDSMTPEIRSANGICCVLGNESYGPSDLLARQSRKIRIPMSNLLESLNVAVAGGIILYEVRKLWKDARGQSTKGTC